MGNPARLKAFPHYGRPTVRCDRCLELIGAKHT
jgi:hypothetical protein